MYLLQNNRKGGTMKNKLLSIILSIISFAWLTPPALAEQVSWLPGMMLGKGYDTVSGGLKGECLTFQTQNVPLQAALQDDWNWQEISSSSDILSLINVDASASAQKDLFSASAEMSMLSQTEVSNFDLTVVAQVSREMKWNLATQSALKDNYQQLAGQNPDQFVSQCGNRYVAGVLYGGKFYTVLSVKTTSQNDKSEVAAAVRVSYGPFGSAQGNVDQKTTAALTSHETTITGYSTGASAGPIPMTLDEVKNRWRNYPAEVQATGGAPMQVILAEYPAIAAQVNPLLYNLATLRWDYATAKREVRYVIDHPAQFYMSFKTWSAFLRELETEAENAVQRIDTTFADCQAKRPGCSRPTGLRSPDQIRADLPPRYIGECGQQTFSMNSFTMNMYPLGVRCGGDREFSGHGPRITINSNVVPKENGKILDVHTYVEMKETKRDWTCFKDTKDSTFANLSLTHPGCYLKGSGPQYITPSTGTLTDTNAEDNHDSREYSGGSGLVQSARCRADTYGNDFGKVGCNNIKFADVSATLNHDEDRMGPNDLSSSAERSWAYKHKLQPEIKALELKQTQKLESTLDTLGPETRQMIEVPLVGRPETEVKSIAPTFKTSPAGRYPKPRKQ